MSLIRMESCDLGGVSGAKWTSIHTSVQFNQTIEGLTCWRYPIGADLTTLVFPSQENSTIVVGTRRWMGHASLGTGAALLNLREGETPGGGTLHLAFFQANNNGSIEVRRGTTTIGSTPALSYPNQQWCYVEIKATIHDTAGVVEIWIDGTLVLNLTSTDTRNGGTNGLIDNIGIGNRLTNDALRDVYVLNGQGSVLNDVLGPQVIQAKLVNGAGGLTNWTPNTGSNFAAVDDSPTHDGDTTYVSTTAAATRDSYEVADFTVPDAINAVQASTVARYSGSPLDVATFIRRSSTNDDGPADTPTGSFGSRAVSIWETDPIAAGAWTLSNLNATEVGIVSS